MFDHLPARLARTIENLRGRGRITDENVAATLRDARVALLEADVALPVVKSFIESVRAKALGAEVLASLTPGQAFIGILHTELVQLMGGSAAPWKLRAQPPAVLLLAGLQGAGKTTTAAKLASWLIVRERKRVLLASTDVRRPAAMLQLERLAGQVQAEYFAASSDQAPALIAGAALDLTGIILTKADGDARGGAALSVRQVTGKPIVFMGVGEKTEALEPFDPERMASRILGMGDVVSLVEQVHRQVDAGEAERLTRKALKGKIFDMVDLKSQLEQLQKLGGVGALLDKLPGALARKGAVSADQGDRELRRQIAIINSMTPRERRNPTIIDGSRRRRIAGGSGVQVQDVNRLLKQFLQMQRVMKSMKGGRLQQLMGAFKGGMPPGFPGGG